MLVYRMVLNAYKRIDCVVTTQVSKFTAVIYSYIVTITS